MSGGEKIVQRCGWKIHRVWEKKEWYVGYICSVKVGGKGREAWEIWGGGGKDGAKYKEGMERDRGGWDKGWGEGKIVDKFG